MKKNYKFSSLHQILDCFVGTGELSPSEIALKLGKSRVIVHRYLVHLVEIGKLQKIGTAPHVRYTLTERNIGKEVEKVVDNPEGVLSYQVQKKLGNTFLKFSPLGDRLDGAIGFRKWCMARGLDTMEKAEQFLKISEYLSSIEDNCGLLDATDIFCQSFEEPIFSHVYYADQYTWMDFGRGRLAELTFYAKLTQDRSLLEESIATVFAKLECLIARENIDAIAITPWSIERKNQLLSILGKRLSIIDIPQISLVKYYKNNIAIPQKSLKTKHERVENARNTIFVEDMSDMGKYKNVLLIDDFVGSGATLYETALKLRQSGVPHIIGFAFVGNTNLSYEVINEI